MTPSKNPSPNKKSFMRKTGLYFLGFFCLLTPLSSVAQCNNQSIEFENSDIAEFETKDFPFSPITQATIIDVSDYGPEFRDREDLVDNLQNLGFKIDYVEKEPSNGYDDEDEPSNGYDDMTLNVYLKASRVIADGSMTRVTAWTEEDSNIKIDFGSEYEVYSFVKSLRELGYDEDGTLFSHPMNSRSMIYVRINGSSAKLIMPWEMLPLDF